MNSHRVQGSGLGFTTGASWVHAGLKGHFKGQQVPALGQESWLVFKRAGAINVHHCGLEPFKPVQAVDLAAGLPESI